MIPIYALKRLSFLILIMVTMPSLVAQAQLGGKFGSAVQVSDEEIYVLKKGGAYGGVAAVFVFDREGGSWALRQTLRTIDAEETGHAMGESMVLGIAPSGTDPLLIVAAADPFLGWGAHTFVRNAEAWSTGERIALSPGNVKSPSSGMSMNDFLQHVYPPARVVAVQDERLALGVTTGPDSLKGVHVYVHDQETWKRQGTIQQAAGENTRQGASVAWGDSYLAVGAPRAARGGSVSILQQNSAGDWDEAALLESDHVSQRGMLGHSLAIDGSYLAVGAPGASGGAGAVLLFKHNPADNSWKEVAYIASPFEGDGGAFGYSIAFIDDEMWVGAPRAEQLRGYVYRYKWNETEQNMELLGSLDPKGEEGARLFGTSIAGHAAFVAIGSIGAAANNGRVAVYERDEVDAWTLAEWLKPHPPLQAVTGSQVRCDDGKASGFDCSEVDLQSFLPIDAFGGTSEERITDLWGWTDPLTEREYALVGRTKGAAIIDVTNPTLPVYLGLVPANPTDVRDLKVYKDHLFFTGDGAGAHGMVVFDLSRLRNLQEVPSMFEPDTVYRGIASAHNLIINTESGFAYPVSVSGGGETCGGGLHMIDIREPLNPTFAGCFTDTIGLFSDGRTHDGQCIMYNGPDARYGNKEICFVSNETGLRIVDVTDKQNPDPISVARYPRTGYVHQGWVTDDHRYFYINDELDELVNMADRTRTIIWDISELDDPVLVGEVGGSTGATDHNLYIKGDRMYQANYQAGMSVWDISDPKNPVEIGHFDTTPLEMDAPGFSGAWTAYPFFKSGNVIVSSIDEGVFVLKPRQQEEMP